MSEQINFSPENKQELSTKEIKFQAQEKAVNAWNEIFTKRKLSANDFKNSRYLSDNFIDSQNRKVEVRLYQDNINPNQFILYENMGDPYALFELKNKLEAYGIIIKTITVHPTTPNSETIQTDINNILKQKKSLES